MGINYGIQTQNTHKSLLLYKMYWLLRRHTSHIYLGILFLLYVLAEVIILPLGDFPVNDDWWYMRLMNDAAFHVWPKHTFVGYMITYKPFTVLFGDSFQVIRGVSMALGFFNILLLNRICSRFLRINKIIVFFICLTMLFNPIYLHLCNSGMTEMVFIFYMLSGLFFYLEFLMFQRTLYYIASLLFFTLMTLTRQSGLALTTAILITDFIVNRDYLKYSAGIFLMSVVSYIIFEFTLYYSDYNSNSYPFILADFTPRINTDILKLLQHYLFRWTYYLTTASLTLSPITGLAFLYRYRTVLRSKSLVIISMILMIPVVYSLRNFPIGNYLNSGIIGPLNIPESYVFREQSWMHEKGSLYYLILTLTVIFSFVFIIMLCYQLTKIYQRFRRFLVSDTLTNFEYIHLLILLFFVFYYLIMTLFDEIFDRYILIPQMLFVIIFVDVIKQHFKKSVITLLLCGFFFILSAFSIHDYFTIRKKSYEIFTEQKNKNKTVVEGFIEDKSMVWLKDTLVRRIDPLHPDFEKPFIGTFVPPNASLIHKKYFFSLMKFGKKEIYLYQSHKNATENN